MKLENLKTIEQMEAFLSGSQAIAFAVATGKDERYQFIEGLLKRFGYSCLKTKGTKGVHIGERRKPQANGKPGYIRIDTVHPGDLDGRKGVYHINKEGLAFNKLDDLAKAMTDNEAADHLQQQRKLLFKQIHEGCKERA